MSQMNSFLNQNLITPAMLNMTFGLVSGRGIPYNQFGTLDFGLELLITNLAMLD